MIANLVLGTDDVDPFDREGIRADHADKYTEDGMRTTPDHAARDDEDLAAGAQSIQNDSEGANPDAMAHQCLDQPGQARNNSAPHTDPPLRSKPVTPKAVALLSTSPVNISRLSQLLLQHLQTTTPNLSLTEAQPIISTALSHIHIYQPTSLPSLLATLSSLPSYFLSPSNISRDRRLGAIVISTPSSYFWEDKLKSTSTSATSTKGKFPALAAVLKRVSTQLSTPIIYTTSHFSSISSDPLALQPALPSPFAAVPTLRLVISRNKVQGFKKEIDAETAVKQTKARDIAVASAGFRVHVNRWGNEGWNERNERQGDTGFAVKIDERGIKLI